MSLQNSTAKATQVEPGFNQGRDFCSVNTYLLGLSPGKFNPLMEVGQCLGKIHKWKDLA